MEMLRAENNVTTQAPVFVAKLPASPRATDFALEQGSANWPPGFEPIPLQEIGLKQDAFRASARGDQWLDH